VVPLDRARANSKPQRCDRGKNGKNAEVDGKGGTGPKKGGPVRGGNFSERRHQIKNTFSVLDVAEIAGEAATKNWGQGGWG